MQSTFASNSNPTPGANLFATTAILGLVLLSCSLSALAQVNVLTQHNDNFRTGANTNETLLTPSNVNTATFGPLFSQAVDGLVAAQPLYVSGLNIPGKGVHNVVFVATLHDSVYAFDADNNLGANATPLWSVNFLNPAAGITTEPVVELGCSGTTAFSEMGILGTPTIDLGSGTMYLVAKTKENGTYHFRFHALDITTGMEKLGGPIDVTGSVTGKIGPLLLTTAAKNMMSRPGVLLSQGIVYIGFGSNGCDGSGTRGWVVAYDATSLIQLGIFNDEVDTTGAHGNIWMAGDGLASDDNGNIFFSTANGPMDANIGNHDYGSSLLKIGWGGGGLVATDYFAPYNQAYLSAHDLDIGSAGVTMLPDQPGPHPHLMVGSGKEGSLYLVDRDNMGGYNPVDNSQIVQFLPFAVGNMESTATYWNSSLYFTGQTHGPSQYNLSNGQMTLAAVSSTLVLNPHTPSISANGNSNGVLWVPVGNSFLAFNATNMSGGSLYTNSKLGTFAHFNTPTIANGHVYLGTNLSVQILGLLSNLAPTSGNGQATAPLSAFPIPLQVAASDAYNATPIVGQTVMFSDGNKGGVFNPVSAVTDSNGLAATNYTAGKTAGTYTITATNPIMTAAKFTLTVTAGSATHIKVVSGSNQTAPIQTTYAAPLVVQALDANNNGVPGVSITFTDGNKGGTFSANPVVTDATGKAQTFYTTGTKALAKVTFTVTSGSLKTAMYGAVTSGPAAAISIVSGNNQTGAVSTTLANPLIVLVVDQFNNAVPGAHITFYDGGAGGTFSMNTIDTDAAGKASVTYTLPPTPGVLNITASFTGGTPVNFTETAQ